MKNVVVAQHGGRHASPPILHCTYPGLRHWVLCGEDFYDSFTSSGDFRLLVTSGKTQMSTLLQVTLDHRRKVRLCTDAVETGRCHHSAPVVGRYPEISLDRRIRHQRGDTNTTSGSHADTRADCWLLLCQSPGGATRVTWLRTTRLDLSASAHPGRASAPPTVPPSPPSALLPFSIVYYLSPSRCLTYSSLSLSPSQGARQACVANKVSPPP
ncbi:hypothetical protein J6590_021175, partial [Homalodisca vitripennis]